MRETADSRAKPAQQFSATVAPCSIEGAADFRPTRRALVGGAIAATVAPSVTLAASGGATEVDLVLMLAADISRSVDSRKFQLQRDGYAAALVDPDVHRAIGRGRLSRIALAYMEWSGNTEQLVLSTGR